MRFFCLLRADKDSEAGVPPDPAMVARMGDFIEKVASTGVLLATDGLHPSSKGARVKLSGGKITVTDGPFTESKELVASYAVLQVGSKDEAIELTSRFLEVLGEGEVEIRQVYELSDFPAESLPPDEAAREEQ